MISAVEALRLPSAQLTPDEVRAADVLELAIENHVRAHMTWHGCEENFTTPEKRSHVMAEVNYRLRKAGWVAQWQMLVEKGRFSSNQIHAGWTLTMLLPSDEARRDAEIMVLGGAREQAIDAISRQLVDFATSDPTTRDIRAMPAAIRLFAEIDRLVKADHQDIPASA